MNNSVSEFATTFSQTRSLPRPNPKSMVTALQQAEITARREKLSIPVAELAGEWRLCFVTGARKDKQNRGIILGRGYYVPRFVFASISFTPDLESGTLGTVTNQLKVGGLYLKFTGPYRYPGKKNLLIFDFTQIHIALLGQTIYQGKIRSQETKDLQFAERPVGKLPFFAFFWAGVDEIAARGRGGGLALWIRDRL